MILSAFSLEGKVAVVTGCDTGLGQGMALGLAQAGCDIVGINIVEPTETIKQVTALGRRFLSLTADLRKIDGIPALLDRAVAEFGHIDILVNNAGLIRREDALEFSEKDWDDVMNLNIKSVFFMSQAAAKHFIAQGNGGKIINIASMLSFQGGIRVPSYTASKSGVMGVTRLMANEWAKHNINVNAIALVTWRPTILNNYGQMNNVARKSSTAFQLYRWGLPSDLMGPVVFLASSASDYVNGYTIAVDGGWLAR